MLIRMTYCICVHCHPFTSCALRVHLVKQLLCPWLATTTYTYIFKAESSDKWVYHQPPMSGQRQDAKARITFAHALGVYVQWESPLLFADGLGDDLVS
jgi:hypothetical protein